MMGCNVDDATLVHYTNLSCFSSVVRRLPNQWESSIKVHHIDDYLSPSMISSNVMHQIGKRCEPIRWWKTTISTCTWFIIMRTKQGINDLTPHEPVSLNVYHYWYHYNRHVQWCYVMNQHHRLILRMKCRYTWIYSASFLIIPLYQRFIDCIYCLISIKSICLIKDALLHMVHHHTISAYATWMVHYCMCVMNRFITRDVINMWIISYAVGSLS